MNTNPITKASQYQLMEGVEVRDVLQILVQKMYLSGEKDTLPLLGDSTALFESDYVQMMQYLMRFMDKGGKQDLEKGRYYLDKLIEAYSDK